MTEDEDKQSNQNLTKTTGAIGILGTRKVGLAAAREAALAKPTEVIDLTKVPNRLGLIFDDSGSMASSYQGNQIIYPIEDAKAGCEEFFKSCSSRDTSIALYNFSGKKLHLSNDLVQLTREVRSYNATAGTPLYGTMFDLLQEPITRAIIFSDGEPTDRETGEAKESWQYPSDPQRQLTGKSIIDEYVDRKIPVDTVFIGTAGSNGETVLRSIAERTSGVFLHFVKGSTTFRQAFKYLAPAYRAMLTDGNFKKRLEQGEVK